MVNYLLKKTGGDFYRMETMSFTIEMNSDYKGKRKDILKLKSSSFLWAIVFGIIFFFTRFLGFSTRKFRIKK